MAKVSPLFNQTYRSFRSSSHQCQWTAEPNPSLRKNLELSEVVFMLLSGRAQLLLRIIMVGHGTGSLLDSSVTFKV